MQINNPFTAHLLMESATKTKRCHSRSHCDPMTLTHTVATSNEKAPAWQGLIDGG
ncbi:hypothetical protein [Aquitalea sp.]|uniref:hypothetical protein n=1 Tax=Aquitalea sp. TaxID=1872623 RepID=UPI0025876A4F|nr:hypothetical protein [Aquitalea sp.]